MKKIIALALVLVMTVALTGCLENFNTTRKNITGGDSGSGSAGTTQQSNNGGTTEQKNDAKSSGKTTIEEAVVLDQSGIKITAKSYEQSSFMGEGIAFLVENNSGKKVTVSTNGIAVNNCMISDLFVASVADGKKATETLYLMSSDLEAAGITAIGLIEIDFRVYDSETYKEVIESAPVTIKTSKYAEMQEVKNEGGKTLYDKNGIKIVGKYVDENSFWGAAVMLYCENKTDRKVTISARDMSVNGFMVTGLFSSTIYPGKVAFDDITLLSSDLKENGITSIDTIALSFHIYESETWKGIDDTDELTFSTK